MIHAIFTTGGVGSARDYFAVRAEISVSPQDYPSAWLLAHSAASVSSGRVNCSAAATSAAISDERVRSSRNHCWRIMLRC